VHPVDYQRILDECSEWEELSSSQRLRHLRAWREVYATHLHAQTGKWKHDGFEWHVFSFDYARALNGDEAEAAYEAVATGELLIVPEGMNLPAVRLQARRLPSFRASREDLYVSPADLSWTMAFTHEESLGLGPYFSRREWM
jgi:hypothetical protein